MAETQVQAEDGGPPLPLPSPAIFDPRAAWRDLPPDVRDTLGLWLLVLLVGQAGAEAGIDPHHAYEAAVGEALVHLEHTAREMLPALFGGPTPSRPDLTALGVRSCRRCGCTDLIGCPEGRWWAEPGLCSRCAEGGRPEVGAA